MDAIISVCVNVCIRLFRFFCSPSALFHSLLFRASTFCTSNTRRFMVFCRVSHIRNSTWLAYAYTYTPFTIHVTLHTCCAHPQFLHTYTHIRSIAHPRTNTHKHTRPHPYTVHTYHTISHHITHTLAACRYLVDDVMCSSSSGGGGDGGGGDDCVQYMRIRCDFGQKLVHHWLPSTTHWIF